MTRIVLDRREFLGSAALTAGAVAASALVPLASVHAVATESSLTDVEPSGTWHVDDMWGHWPPYAHPIPYGRPEATPSLAELADAADRNFVL
jgi:hypothetical protein